MGGGAQPHSIAFGGVFFPNITEAILVDEISTTELTPQKWSLNTKIYEFLMKRIGSSKNGNIRVFFRQMSRVVSTRF